MKGRIHFVALVVAVGVWASGDLLACGDKFLVAGRGTRFQRPKNARAASVLIYADPSTTLPGALKKMKLEAILKLEGHRSTTVETFDQLSAIIDGGRFDVILASTNVAGSIEKLLGDRLDAAVVVPMDAAPKAQPLLTAIDKAVEQHDQKARRTSTRS